MLIRDFLTLLLDDTLEDARLRYCRPTDTMAFQGAEHALEECRAAMQGEAMSENLRALVADARRHAELATGEADEWFWMTREMYIEWIAQVVSVVLVSHRCNAILPPSRAAALEAARLLDMNIA
ncbi:hypothetical protein HMPREF9946_03342 [Acetobacteraceae bacterium AT-5844]|nr:hypothetical protein HMPREF9946_03342 [Acetobacteraceae bacterium AT-5844]